MPQITKDAVAIQQCGNDLQVAILNSTYETIFTINDNTAKNVFIQSQ